jgi:DNA-binding MarR family transcriptional regulator
MTQPAAPVPIGQYIGEAEGALTALLEGALRGTELTRNEYITLQVLAQRGPFEDPGDLHQFLAGARQLRMDRPEVAELLEELERKGLVTGASLSGAGPAQLTEHGTEGLARVRERVGSITRRLVADVDPKDLETTRRVLVGLAERAKSLE